MFVRYKDMQDTLVERTVMLEVSNGEAVVQDSSSVYTTRDLALVSIFSTILTGAALLLGFCTFGKRFKVATLSFR